MRGQERAVPSYETPRKALWWPCDPLKRVLFAPFVFCGDLEEAESMEHAGEPGELSDGYLDFLPYPAQSLHTHCFRATGGKMMMLVMLIAQYEYKNEIKSPSFICNYKPNHPSECLQCVLLKNQFELKA